MNPRIADLPFDPTTLTGLSEKLLRSHHQNNYGGAVKRLNAIRAELAGSAFVSLQGFKLNGLKREELIATNSMLLHLGSEVVVVDRGLGRDPACFEGVEQRRKATRLRVRRIPRLATPRIEDGDPLIPV